MARSSNICRFCLCQDVNLLSPLSKILDVAFSMEDIERYTSILIPEGEQCFCAICEKCYRILETSTSFRYSCLSNDIIFNQLFSPYAETHLKDFNIADDSDRKENHVTSLKIEIVLPEDAYSNNDDCPSNYDDGDKSSVASCDGWDATEPTIATNDESEARTGKPEGVNTEDSSTLKTVRKRRARKLENAIDSDGKKLSKSVNRTSKAKSKKLCGICGALVTDLNSHGRIHSKENFLTCSYCPIKMASRANLLRHVQAVHVKKIVKSCEFCDKGFTSTNSYRSHMRSHHGIGETYDCKICFKSFNHPSNYKDHFNRLHHTRMDYKCRICGKLFKDKTGLRGHRKVHSSSKPFSCNECPKRFKSRYARNVHQITHSGIRFSCTRCEKSYQYKRLLSTHYKQHHANVESSQTGDS
uniref:Protein krueppel n=1 Tax=Anopheles atroparvus TaxID=41427 RepID=A0AAG5DI58_ANOAO